MMKMQYEECKRLKSPKPFLRGQSGGDRRNPRRFREALGLRAKKPVAFTGTDHCGHGPLQRSLEKVLGVNPTESDLFVFLFFPQAVMGLTLLNSS